jgi:hypothetical protein
VPTVDAEGTFLLIFAERKGTQLTINKGRITKAEMHKVNYLIHRGNVMNNMNKYFFRVETPHIQPSALRAWNDTVRMAMLIDLRKAQPMYCKKIAMHTSPCRLCRRHDNGWFHWWVQNACVGRALVARAKQDWGTT